ETLIDCRLSRLEGFGVMLPVASASQPCSTRPALFTRKPWSLTVNEPARVNERGSVGGTLVAWLVVTKKPWPEMARCSGELVWMSWPCWSTSWRVTAITPPPELRSLWPSVEVTRLSKSVWPCLKPTVFTLAMLLEMVANAEELATRPETPASIALLRLMALSFLVTDWASRRRGRPAGCWGWRRCR